MPVWKRRWSHSRIALQIQPHRHPHIRLQEQLDHSPPSHPGTSVSAPYDPQADCFLSSQIRLVHLEMETIGPPIATIPLPIHTPNRHNRRHQSKTQPPGTPSKTPGDRDSTLTHLFWGWMQRVEPFPSHQTLSPPCLTNLALRCPNHKLGPPNLVSLQASRVRTTTNQGNREIRANFHPLPTLFLVELFLRSLPIHSVQGHRLPLTILGTEADPKLVVALQRGPSYFAPCSEVNRPKKGRILSALRNLSKVRNTSRWG